METLFLNILVRRPKDTGIKIEPAQDCDGSRCHQPIFREDGELNHVAPHYHLVERNEEGVRYYPIFGDFPQGDVPVPMKPRVGADELFGNYPPFDRG